MTRQSPITAVLTPRESAEKAVQAASAGWSNADLLTGHLTITADDVCLGYWIDSGCGAHPGWLVHVWGILRTEAGTLLRLTDQWFMADFADGTIYDG